MMNPQTQATPLAVVAFGGRAIGIDAQSGQRVWEHDTGIREEGNRVFVCENRVFLQSGKHLLCLDYGTGRRLWTSEVPPVFTFVNSTMTAFAGLVLLGSRGEVACYRANDGARLWHDEFKGYGLSAVSIAVPGLAVQSDIRG